MKHLQKETWELKTLEEIATEICRGTGVTESQLGSGDFPAVKNKDICSGLEQQFKQCINFINPKLIKNPKYFQHGDLLISCLGSKKSIGKTCVYLGEDKCIAGNDIAIITHKQNPKYLVYALSSSSYRKQIEVHLQDSTVCHLYSKGINQIKIPLPSLNIQSQIANYLDKFSELIKELIKELRETLIESKRQYSYYLNSLIGRSEEEVRKKNWEIKNLDEIAVEIYRGNGITKRQLIETGYPAIRYSEIHNSSIFIKECKSFVNIDEIKNKKYCEFGNLLIVNSSEDLENSGKSVTYLNKQKCLVGNDISVIKHNQNYKYISFVLASEFCKKQIKFLSKGETVIHLYASHIKQIKIPLPSLGEQERIVSVLDKFHSICEDIEEGIPALIRDVTKQYEYYRDQIFS